MNKLAAKLILVALSPNPMPVIKQLLEQVTAWDVVTNLIIERQAAPLILYRLKNLNLTYLLPNTVCRKWEQAAWKTLTRSMLLSNEFLKVVSVLSARGIEVIPMKGIYLSEILYPAPGLRQFSDIDLLVHEADSDSAVDALQELGYIEEGLSSLLPEDIHAMADTSHRPPLVRQGIMVEIHTRVHRRREPWNINLQELWSCTVHEPLYGVDVRVFSREYQLITVVLHLDKHFREGKMQLTGYYDLIFMVQKWRSEIDWLKFLNVCDQANCTTVLLTHLALLAHNFGITLPSVITSHALFGFTKSQLSNFKEIIEYGKALQYFSLSSLNPLFYISDRYSRIRYAWFYLFPPVEFIMKQFGLKKRRNAWKYYIFRIVRPVMNLLLTIWRRVFVQQN